MSYLIGRDLRFERDGVDVVSVSRITVAPGRVTVLVAPTGAGKTTLLWLMAGLLTPTAGQVRAPTRS